MPKALVDFLGYAIYFWLNENEPLEPVHVHIAKGRPTANATKVWITRSGVRLVSHLVQKHKNNCSRCSQMLGRGGRRSGGYAN